MIKNGFNSSKPTARPTKLITVLFLSAKPIRALPLKLHKEFSAIDEELSHYNVRERFNLIEESHTSLSKLTKYIFRYNPNIIHFSGNATSECLIFENVDGEMEKANVDTLRDIFRIVCKKVPIQCVVLNACNTENVAKAISEFVDCVIGIPGDITDEAAITFASSFYEALGNRLNVTDAVSLGLIKLKDMMINQSQTVNEAVMPKIYSRPGIDPSKVIILEQSLLKEEPVSSAEVEPSMKSYQQEQEKIKYDAKKIFIEHGHDEGSKYALAEILRELGLEPIILHTQANAGKTIVEKFEEHAAKVGYAFVLLTPDDEGREKFENINSSTALSTKEGLRSRARQNVILELGYFMGRLGRDRVCCLYKGNIDTPSDIYGIAHLEYEKSIDECYREIIRELSKAEYLHLIFS